MKDVKFDAFLKAFENVDKEEGYHQAILNIGYNKWQSVREWKYEDMLNWVEAQFGQFPRLAIQIGKYNQQVTNGGHIQYFDNGYASEGGGCFTKHDPFCPLHKRMVFLFKESGLTESYLARDILKIMEEFYVELDMDRTVDGDCDECEGSGNVYDDEGEPHRCDYCGGSGVDQIDNENYGCIINDYTLNQLDDRYYEIYEEWMDVFEGICKRYVETGDVIIVETRDVSE